MKKLTIFLLLVVTSLLLTSCSYEEVKAYLTGNPNVELTQTQRTALEQVEIDRGGGRPN